MQGSVLAIILACVALTAAAPVGVAGVKRDADPQYEGLGWKRDAEAQYKSSGRKRDAKVEAEAQYRSSDWKREANAETKGEAFPPLLWLIEPVAKA